VFFSIFEITRGLAISAKTFSQTLVHPVADEDGKDRRTSILRHSPRIIHATTLVCGGTVAGLAYEMVCRPLDNARRAVHLDKISAHGHHSIVKVLQRQIRDAGISSLFKDRTVHLHDAEPPTSRSGLSAFLRTLGRISPWGLAFICFEAFGPGIS
jgi:Mitochondrial carrier protein